MATLEDRKAALQARHNDELKRLEREGAILELIPDALLTYDVMVHPTKLYDRAASIHVNWQRYESIKKGQNPTLDSIREWAEVFPANVPVSLFRDGSVGIRTRAEIDGMTEDKQERATVTPLGPVWVSFEPGIGQECATHWLTQTAEGIIEIKIEFPIYSEVSALFGRASVHYSYYGQSGEVSGIKSQSFEAARNIHVVGSCKAANIRYASGDHKSPGHVLLYWEDHSGDESGIPFTVAELLAEATK